jgi:membrane-bound metal-dependent hydrolase YbcI (DUF457 family)
MPITPFHFGPGAALHSLAPRHVSLLAFCAANVLMDLEPLYYMLTHQYPLHRFIHTYLGAALMAGSTVLLFALSLRAASRGRLSNPFDWQTLGIGVIALGAIAGTFSHVLLDSVMHVDIRPFAPFSNANPLLGALSLQALHGSCVASGVVGITILGIRALWSEIS